jgi:hypothetical protein
VLFSLNKPEEVQVTKIKEARAHFPFHAGLNSWSKGSAGKRISFGRVHLRTILFSVYSGAMWYLYINCPLIFNCDFVNAKQSRQA